MTTTTSLPPVLLSLLSPQQQLKQDQLDALTDADWQVMQRMWRQHRLAPLLHWQRTRAHAHLQLPEWVKTNWAQGFKRAAFRSLLCQQGLANLHQTFEQAGIPYVALKGAFLAHQAYPHAALRPMRDLDVLVPAPRLLEAYDVLLKMGLNRLDRYPGSPDAAMLVHKHLPPLSMPNSGMTVELHGRLLDLGPSSTERDDLSEEPGFWDRVVQAPLAGQSLRFASPTDLLLHLIIHAVYDHKFNNGPLLLSDIAFLTQTQPVNWSLFWQLARQRDATRGCVLALKLTLRYWPVPQINWLGHESEASDLTEDTLDAAAALMLQDMQARGMVIMNYRLHRSPSWINKLAYVSGKLLLPPTHMAARYPTARKGWRVYLHYPKEWLRLANVWRASRHPDTAFDTRQDVMHLDAVTRWLK
jgi:hypothetical protein